MWCVYFWFDTITWYYISITFNPYKVLLKQTVWRTPIKFDNKSQSLLFKPGLKSWLKKTVIRSVELYQSSSPHRILNPEASSSKVGPVVEGGQSFQLVHRWPGTGPVLADDTQGEHNSIPVTQMSHSDQHHLWSFFWLRYFFLTLVSSSASLWFSHLYSLILWSSTLTCAVSACKYQNLTVNYFFYLPQYMKP